MNVDIESLSVPQKLELVDRIWSSLCATPDSVPSPDWHEELIAERLTRLENGEATISSLEDVKKRLENKN